MRGRTCDKHKMASTVYEMQALRLYLFYSSDTYFQCKFSIRGSTKCPEITGNYFLKVGRMK